MTCCESLALARHGELDLAKPLGMQKQVEARYGLVGKVRIHFSTESAYTVCQKFVRKNVTTK
jgi:hypothetical protein